MNLTATREGIGIALEALRANKVRAALTILGIVIGVATVMAMAAMIAGIRGSLTDQISAAGPENFTVSRFDLSGVRLGGDGGRPAWMDYPSITLAEAERLAALPSVRSVVPAVITQATLRYEGETVPSVDVLGRGAEWPEYQDGDFVAGRNFLPVDAERSAAVVVLSERLAESVFGTGDAVGAYVRMGGARLRVVGVYKQSPNLFADLTQSWAVVPTTTAFRRMGASDRWMELLVVTAPGATQAAAMDDVTATLRISRGLRPGDDNNFAVVSNEALTEMFDRLTGVFFLVMLVLSSIGLMVGGVGVVAIMMISVTERTREIGVRKALGATRREILWQFLVESMTVTALGGALGLLLGGAISFLVAALTPLPAVVPLWAVLAALGVSAACGIGFGIYPAARAARLDPVEALRYE